MDSSPDANQALSLIENRQNRKLRLNYPRTRTGCLTCRRRKKKCNEEKPRCIGCRRNMFECQWPSEQDMVQSVQSPLRNCPGHAHDESTAQPSLSTFRISELSGNQRACTLTPVSLLLLRHYLSVTTGMLAVTSVEKNPFMTHIAPLAYTDDLLMHSMLALSGNHLAFRQDSDMAVQTAAWRHYSIVVRGVGEMLTNLDVEDSATMLRLLLILIIMCHVEGISGDMNDSMFQHLRAGRELIVRLLSHSRILDKGQVSMEYDCFGICHELYAYMVLVNSLEPYSGVGIGNLAYDSFVMSLGNLNSYSTFGAIFGGSHGLFEMIPQVSALASRRLAEEAMGDNSPSPECAATYNLLCRRIDHWSVTPNVFTDDATDHEEQRIAAEFLRRGLYIYLETSLAGSIVSDHKTLSIIESHIEAMIPLVHALAASQYLCTMMWPSVIAGSCMLQDTHRTAVVQMYLTLRYDMRHILSVVKMLQLLWEDNDPRAYGPYGLYLVKEKHGMHVHII